MSRLSKDWQDEVVLYLSPNGDLTVSHTCKVGAASPEQAVRMLWQAMNMTAIQHNLTLNFGGPPVETPPPVSANGNGHAVAEVP